MEPVPSGRVFGVAPGRVTPEPITRQSARGLAERVAAGELNAEEIVEAHLQRIAAIDGELNSVVHLDADGARSAARAGDRERRNGRAAGPLAGVPVLIKDNVDVRRQTTACGSHAHAGVLALRDATVVSRLRNAGAIVLGRTNMDELAMGASTLTSAHGHTENPWDTRRSPGGSSGGSAAAVAAGLAPISVGTDTGGSIREPASQCGIVGMAPTPRLVSKTGVVPFAQRFDRVGPFARTVEDTALFLAVLAGRPALADLDRHPVRELRVGVVDELRGPPNQEGVRERLSATLALLGSLDIDVVEVSIPDAGQALQAYTDITSAAAVTSLEPYALSGRAGEEVMRRWKLGRGLLESGDELARSRVIEARVSVQCAAALRRCDVLLSPTMPSTAPILRPNDAQQAHDLTDPLHAPYTDCWTVVANLAGLPALSLPAGRSPEDGMPVGVMLTGARGSDGALLALARLLEASGLDAE